MNENDFGLGESIGGGITVSFTGKIRGSALAPMIVTVPEYIPAMSMPGLTDIQIIVDVVPLVRLTASHGSPEVDAVKLPPGALLASMKQTGAGGGKPGW